MNASEDHDVECDLTFLPSGRTETLDVYIPQGSAPAGRPAVLFLHGGNFCRDDKASSRSVEFCSMLAAAGYVVVSPNYALSEGESGDARWTAWPRNLLDCRAALVFLAANSGRFGVDPKRVGALGVSAGATLALVLAFATSDELSRLAEAEDEPFLAAVLTVHGTADDVVPFVQAELLDRALDRVGAEHQLHPIEGAEHTFATRVNGHDIGATIAAYLKARLR